MLNIKNIKVHCYFDNKLEIFKAIENDLIDLRAAKKGIYESLIKRDQISSVALGNYLYLPHANSGDDDLILKNTILVYHLKDTMIIDGSEIKIVIALALKQDNQMEFIEKIGLAFFDEDEVTNILFNKSVSQEEIYKFLTSSK